MTPSDLLRRQSGNGQDQVAHGRFYLLKPAFRLGQRLLLCLNACLAGLLGRQHRLGQTKEDAACSKSLSA